MKLDIKQDVKKGLIKDWKKRLKEMRKNPITLKDHKYIGKPIGKLVKTKKVNGVFVFSIVPLKGKKRILKKAIEFVNMIEIGYIPKIIKKEKDWIGIDKFNLIEISLIPTRTKKCQKKQK